MFWEKKEKKQWPDVKIPEQDIKDTNYIFFFKKMINEISSKLKCLFFKTQKKMKSLRLEDKSDKMYIRDFSAE